MKKEDFEIMINDWSADNWELADDLKMGEPYINEDGAWEIEAEDKTTVYILTSDKNSNIVLNYSGTI